MMSRSAAYVTLRSAVEVLQVDKEEVSRNVSDLLTCIASKGEILACPLAGRLISRVGMVSNYVSVLRTITKDPQVITSHTWRLQSIWSSIVSSS